jgi:hypothetical protein
MQAFVLVLASLFVSLVTSTKFFDFSVKAGENKEVRLSTYAKSRVILVVNVASACGYTDSNYRELQVQVGMCPFDVIIVIIVDFVRKILSPRS